MFISSGRVSDWDKFLELIVFKDNKDNNGRNKQRRVRVNDWVRILIN